MEVIETTSSIEHLEGKGLEIDESESCSDDAQSMEAENSEIQGVEELDFEDEGPIDQSRYADWARYIDLDVPKLRKDVVKKGSQRHFEGKARGLLNENLCRYCANIFDNWDAVLSFLEARRAFDSLESIASPFFTNFNDIYKSALQGCIICIKIVSIIKLFPKKVETGKMSSVRTSLRDWRGRGIAISSFWSFSIWNHPSSHVAEITITPTAKLRQEKMVVEESRVPYDQQDFGCLANSTWLTHGWLKRCLEQHKSCQHDGTRRLPTRLIKIGPQHNKIYVTQEDDSFKYATLSHCWGESRYLQLLTLNISNLVVQIPQEELSKTARDAIEIARTLGFEYLWIDSLCIMQDDAEDWKREASRMADVYGYADLNIAATAASDGSVGCLFKRDVSYAEVSSLQVLANGERASLEFRDAFLLRANLDEAPLSMRGWALQERLLAPRTLHFTQSQLFWECREFFACETWPDGDIIDRDGILTPIPTVAFWNDWGKIVKAYTMARLTYSSDRAVAISGIARKFRSLNGDRYIAGLWERTFVTGLCWFQSNYGTRRSPDPQRAIPRAGTVFPSWSWLSVINTDIFMVSHGVEIIRSYANVVDIHITHENDCFGDIKESALTIDARFLIRAKLALFRDVLEFEERDYHRLTLNILDDVPILKAGLESNFGGVYLDYPISELRTTTIIIVPLHRTKWNSIYALMLGRIHSTSSKYRRVGIFKASHYDIGIDHKREPEPECDCAFCDLAEYFDTQKQTPFPPDEQDYVEESVDENGQTWYRIVIE